MEYSTEKEQIVRLEKELLIEKVLYANMKEVLERREEEIAGLYDVVNELMSLVKP